MEHKFINQIKAGENVQGIYVCKDPILRSTTKGDFYIAMYLCDRTGQINGRMWQASEAIYAALPKPGFVQIQSRSELYQNNLQIVINSIRPVDPNTVNAEDFLARTDKNVDQMFLELCRIASKIKNPEIKLLVDEFINDEELMTCFKKAPAAIKMHHNFLGGLLEHTLSMLKVAEMILPLYPKVNPDLVLAGIFLHDIGKTEELCYEMAFSYTDTGQLLGHIAKSFLMVNRFADKIAAAGTPIHNDVLDQLGHIILCHHGKYEFGSPKLPATPEAFMVNYIDDLDAKLNQVNQLIENEPGDSNWTAWQQALETKIFRKRLNQ